MGFVKMTFPVCFTISVGLAATCVAQIQPTERIVMTGQQAPGFDEGIVIQQLDGGGVINNLGQVLFAAILDGPLIGSDNNNTIWIWSEGQLELVLQEGQDASGTPAGVIFGDGPTNAFRQIVFSAQGDFAFQTRVMGPGVTSDNDYGVWGTRGGQLMLVAREGDPAPGTPDGVIFSNIERANLYGPTGMLDLLGHLTGPGTEPPRHHGLWIGEPGAMTLLFRIGQPMPGVDGTMLSMSQPLMNSTGHMAVSAAAEATSGDVIAGIWVGAHPDLRPLILNGDPAPPAGDDVWFQYTGPLGFNSSDDLAFKATLVGDSINIENDKSLWLLAGGKLSLLFQELDLLPGFENEIRAGTVIEKPILNDLGMVAFRGDLRGDSIVSGNATCLWRVTTESLTLVAREGDPPPDRSDRGSFDNFISDNETRPIMNNAGTIVFGINLVDQGVSTHAIFTHSESRGLQTLGADGDMIEVAPGDFQQTGGIAFFRAPAGSGGPDGQTSSLNDQDQFVLQASLPGGQRGLFLMDLSDPCYADFNSDGAVDTMDFLAFLNAFQTSDPSADCNSDSLVDTLDFLCFLNAFVAGC